MKIVTPYAEADLIEGCKQDNPKMQRALYNKYNRLMYGVCLRYAAGADDAKDIVQEGFIKVFKNIHSFQAKGSFE
ncbi:MAG: sigma factor, partial [Bacteroidota bacterium]